MEWTRRSVLGSAAAAIAAPLVTGGCAAGYGSSSSYLTPILAPANRNTVFHWADIVMQQVREQRIPAPHAAYNFGAPLAAGFLAANGIARRYAEPFGVGDGPGGADMEVAYGVAFATVAAECFQQPFLIERLAFKDRFPDGEAKRLGIEWGRRVGMHVARMRTRDGSEQSRINYYLGRFPRRGDAMQWTPTGPHYGASPGPAFATYDRGLYPGLGAIRPWTMTSQSQFRPPAFHDPASPEFAAEFEHIRTLGAADSETRSEDQSEIALFWEDGPWGITPPGHFLLIGIQVLQDRGFDFLDIARAIGLLGMTLCDAGINAWDSKYHHDILRPETAIRSRAPAFANPDPRVHAYPGWRSYIPTPEFPSYTSGHSTFGAAATELIALLIGTDEVGFSHESPDQVIWPQLRGVRRSWTRLSQAADENGMSRLYGGVHWEADHLAAMRAGRSIARQAFERTFPRRG